MSKNPYAEADGSPKKGQESKFLDWESIKERERIEKLTPLERKKQQSRANKFRDRMES